DRIHVQMLPDMRGKPIECSLSLARVVRYFMNRRPAFVCPDTIQPQAAQLVIVQNAMDVSSPYFAVSCRCSVIMVEFCGIRRIMYPNREWLPGRLQKPR